MNPADTPVFVAEALFMAEDARNALAHALFTRLGAPALTMTPQAVSAVHGCGVTTGLVLDLGLLEATAVSVVDGYPLYHTMQSTRRAGAAVEAEVWPSSERVRYVLICDPPLTFRYTHHLGQPTLPVACPGGPLPRVLRGSLL